MSEIAILGELLGPQLERLLQVDKGVAQVEEGQPLHGHRAYPVPFPRSMRSALVLVWAT
ncbi:hypothetical protein [Streptosporangium saharense]|uniref:hypothetical protein n=1 Tax=Streptosporangium saharense TaxID=1706840 RepID=UPI0034382249